MNDDFIKPLAEGKIENEIGVAFILLSQEAKDYIINIMEKCKKDLERLEKYEKVDIKNLLKALESLRCYGNEISNLDVSYDDFNKKCDIIEKGLKEMSE